MPAHPEAGPVGPAETRSQGESLPLSEAAGPAAWERFKRELDESVPPGDGEEVSAINNIVTQLMQAGVNADKVFEQVAASAARLTGATGSAIALAEGGKFVCRASYGDTAPPLGSRLDPGSGLSGLCVRTGNLLRCDDAEHDPRVDSELTRLTGIRSISVVPVIKDGRLVGIFEILSGRAHAFEKKQTETLQRMAKLVVLTMSRVGELRGRTVERRSYGQFWRVLAVVALAFVIGFAAARLLGPVFFGR